MQREIVVENFGRVQIKNSAQAKYLRLKVNLKQGVVAVVPSGISEKQVLKFIMDNRSWLKKVMHKHEKIRKQFTLFTHDAVYKTRYHTLRLLKHDKRTVKSLVSNRMITIWYPMFADVTDDRIQKIIRRAVVEAWRREAKMILPQRTETLARKHHFEYKQLRIKNAQTRWGSCSADNNINLNLQLMRLPDDLIDYVILHELTHTVYKHHQKEFWNTLERILPGSKSLDKSLNTYHLEIW